MERGQLGGDPEVLGSFVAGDRPPSTPGERVQPASHRIGHY
jgi:hypothetical protein